MVPNFDDIRGIPIKEPFEIPEINNSFLSSYSINEDFDLMILLFKKPSGSRFMRFLSSDSRFFDAPMLNGLFLSF